MNNLYNLLMQDKIKNILKKSRTKDEYILLIDYLYKYYLIIEDNKYLDKYLNKIKHLLNKKYDLRNLELKLNNELAKIIIKKEEYKKKESHEKVLRYIYNKYVKEGYFYISYSSNYYNYLNEYGISKYGFKLDNELNNINNIFHKYLNRNIIYEKLDPLSDSFRYILDKSLLEPFFIKELFDSNLITKETLYKKDIYSVIEEINKLSIKYKITNSDRLSLINSFKLVWDRYTVKENDIMLACIKRKYLKKDKIKDLEEIIKDDKIKIDESIDILFESRYLVYEIEEDINKENIEYIFIPYINKIIEKYRKNYF